MKNAYQNIDKFNKYGLLSAIGNTPLIQLKNILKGVHFKLYAKLEFLNPGGSIKDRTALKILQNAWKEHLINRDSTIIESSSGNFGIGLAQICRALKLKFICVVDRNLTTQNFKILKAYGAQIEQIDESFTSEGFLKARIARVKEIMAVIPNSFWCNQYANSDNWKAHYQTMHEIVTALNGQVDYVFCATSTCGTLRGCYEYVKKNCLNIRIVAVDAEGSVIFGQAPKKRLLPGHGAGCIPDLYIPGIESEYITIDDLASIRGCRNLLENEAILAGGSSGAIISAVENKKNEIPPSANCVVILCDRGERYLDTIYSNKWVHANFGSFLLPI